jgi:hypothetical protein
VLKNPVMEGLFSLHIFVARPLFKNVSAKIKTFHKYIFIIW